MRYATVSGSPTAGGLAGYFTAGSNAAAPNADADGVTRPHERRLGREPAPRARVRRGEQRADGDAHQHADQAREQPGHRARAETAQQQPSVRRTSQVTVSATA